MTEAETNDDLQAAFDGALSREGSERESFLADLMAREPELGERVSALISAHRSMGGFLESAATVADDTAPLDLTGTTIGPYTIAQPLGEGGFGTVYGAEQNEPIQRSVALKVLKPGMDSRQVLARFDAERRALALMDHPNIARVFDAGVTDTGRPYFVMERVDGVPITEYCNRERLSPRARLTLFRDVCAAVHHAHQKGVVHRDLKPSNILVTDIDGKPASKVIDFGIAKALHDEGGDDLTQQHQFLGTPAYMSPEQTEPGENQLDTRSDVYSLGVVLYELLIGSTPVRGDESRGSTPAEIFRTIREVEPARPSTRLHDLARSPSATDATADQVAEQRGTDTTTLVRLLQRDLDWIVMRAIEKDRERRYDSASALSADLRRFLDGDPVEARPPSPWYRWGKIIHRHRVAFATGGTFFVVLLAAVTVLTFVSLELNRQRNRASEAEEDAKAERSDAVAARDESDEVTLFLATMFENVAPEGMGYDVRVREVLEWAAGTLDTQLADRPRVRARLRHTIGTSFRSLGLFDEAAEQLEQAVSERTELFGAMHRDTRESRRALSAARRNAGHLNAAIRELKQLLSDEAELELAEKEEILTQYEYGVALLDLGRYPEALAILTTCREVAARHPDRRWLWLASALSLGAIHERLGEVDLAEARFRDVLEGTPNPAKSANALDANHRLATLLMRRGRVAESKTLLSSVLETLEKELGPDHLSTFNARGNLALIATLSGDLATADRELTELIADASRVFGEENTKTHRYRMLLSGVRLRQYRLPDAETLLRRVAANYESTYGASHPQTVHVRHQLGDTLLQQGRTEDAESIYTEVLQQSLENLGPLHPSTLKIRMSLGTLYSRTQRLEESVRETTAAIAGFTESLGPESPINLGARTNLGGAYRQLKRYDEAEELLLSTLAIKRRTLGPRAAYTRNCLSAIGNLYLQWGRPADAIPYLEEYLSIVTDNAGEDHPRTQRARARLEEARRGTRD